MSSAAPQRARMRAILSEAYKGLDGLQLRTIDVPTPQPGEVLVRIHAAGVNPVDIAVAGGALQAMMPLAFPAVAGGEIAGIVSAVPAGETTWQVGDAVHALMGISGAFAEYAAVPATALVRKPAAMSFAEAAALPIAAGTATAALDQGNVGPGTRVVVHAAAGGVGTVLVQLAKARGAFVIALASPGNIEYVTALGANEVVDRTGEGERTIRDADVVVDAFGPAAQDRSWTMLRRGGALVSLVSEPSAELAAKYDIRVHRVFGNRDPAVLRHADDLFRAGQLRLHVTARFALEDAVAALRLVESGSGRGKVVLDIQGGNP